MRTHLARSSRLLFCAALALLMPACQNGGNWTIFGYRLGPLRGRTSIPFGSTSSRTGRTTEMSNSI